MNQNYNYGAMNVNPTPVQAVPATNTQASDPKKMIFYILLAIAAVGCFLPFLTISFLGEEVLSMNYVYYEGNPKDGIYIIILMIAALSTSLKKGFKPTIAFMGIAVAVLAYDFIDIQSTMGDLTYSGLYEVSYGIGFYLVTVGLVGALILSIMLSKSDPATSINSVSAVTNVNVYQQPTMPQNQYMNPQPNYGQPMQQAPAVCSYCGSPRNEGMFCKSCGGKY